ncbi:MAG: saccharopine dehydrogenase C-terminal domain-containing protein [archaeon]
MGRIIVRDLSTFAKHVEIVIVGRDEKKARAFIREVKNPSIEFVQVDVNDVRQTAHALKGAAVCINAVQYELNEKMMRACLLAKCHYIDLGGLFHVTRKQLKWSGKFKRAGLLAVLGMGAAPGVTNILAKMAMDRLDTVEQIHIRVGGKDFTRMKHPPVIYFPYSPKTVLEEHSIPPMIYTKGKWKQIPARSLKEGEDFGGKIGKLTVMATLHSEVATLPKFKPGIKECTFQISFPGDFEKKVSFLVEAGFANPENIDFTSRILSQLPKPGEKPRDIEVLRSFAVGMKNKKRKTIIVDARFTSNPRWGVGAGDVDTGVPPSIVAQMVAHGTISVRGVLPPEQCVPVKPFLRELERRGMRLKVSSR